MEKCLCRSDLGGLGTLGTLSKSGQKARVRAHHFFTTEFIRCPTCPTCPSACGTASTERAGWALWAGCCRAAKAPGKPSAWNGVLARPRGPAYWLRVTTELAQNRRS